MVTTAKKKKREKGGMGGEASVANSSHSPSTALLFACLLLPLTLRGREEEIYLWSLAQSIWSPF